MKKILNKLERKMKRHAEFEEETLKRRRETKERN